MSDLNQVSVIGRMTKAPEIRYTQSQKAITKFTIANNFQYGDNKKANYFNVTVWGKQAENISKYCKKGKQIAISGRLDFESWEDKTTGQKRSSVSIVADSVQFLGDAGSQPTGQAAGLNNNYQQGQNNQSDYKDPWG